MLRIAFLDDLPREMRDRPEQEQDGQPARDGAHEIDAAGRGMRVVAEENDEKPAQEHEQRGAGGVGDLQLITAGDELTAIPEAAGGFHGHNEDSAGNQSDYPANDIIRSVEIHGMYDLF